MLFFPGEVDVPMARTPWGNFILVASIAMVSILAWCWEPLFESLILRDAFSLGLIGHPLAHVGVVHLALNLLYLWVFGNAVCAKLGSGPYAVLFFLFGILGAATHLALDGGAAVGASGAISGVLGVFAFVYPANSVQCWVGFWYGTVHHTTFEVRAWVLLGLFFLLNLLGALRGGDGIAYWAHLGGFAAGFGFAWLAVARNLVRMERAERSLIDLWQQRRRKARPWKAP